MRTVWIRWSECGRFIRKWDVRPFEGGEAYERKGCALPNWDRLGMAGPAEAEARN